MTGLPAGRPTGVRLYAQTGRRALAGYGLHPAGAIGGLSADRVFVVGSPRSGTTFAAGSLGRVPGFADLGEVSRWKAEIPDLYRALHFGHRQAVVRRVRTVLNTSQRVAMAARKRAIEQTPESSFLIGELAQAFPRARFVHLVRDGRDVAASLLERGWLAGRGRGYVAARAGERLDDAGAPFGGYARFWVEPERREEFESASEIRRCAWAWRRYAGAAHDALARLDPARVITVRYEELVQQPSAVAADLAAGLRLDPSGTRALTRALAAAHPNSVGTHRTRLTARQRATVQHEAAPLLTALGYT